jgi:RNA polymerase sigma-70 factor (ECF subfamily)
MAPSHEPSDEALVCRIRERDQEALGLLFKRYARLVWSVAEKVLEDGAEAEDVMQEVFLLIYKKPFIFESSKGPARRLIVFVAYQSAFTRRRYLRTRHAHATGDSGTVGATEAAPSAALYDESMEAHFGREKLRLALADMSEDQRRTLRMHFFEGYTVSEIAQKLHQPQGNVKHHLYRGLEKLRKHLPRSENGG